MAGKRTSTSRASKPAKATKPLVFNHQDESDTDHHRTDDGIQNPNKRKSGTKRKAREELDDDMNDLMAKLIQQQQNQRPNQVSAHVTTAASKPTTTPTLLNRAFTTTGTESEYERSLKKFVTEEMETELAVFRVNLDSQTKALKRRFEGFVMVAGRESKRVKEDVELGLASSGKFSEYLEKSLQTFKKSLREEEKEILQTQSEMTMAFKNLSKTGNHKFDKWKQRAVLQNKAIFDENDVINGMLSMTGGQ